MKKKILCSILAIFMLISTLPLSVFADELEAFAGSNGSAARNTGLPVVSVESLRSFSQGDHLPEHFFRALPEDDGTFYLDIVLDKAPEADEDIVVYYRTIDDSAVAKWGDYESVGVHEEAYVTLNKSNGYRARVTVKSTVLDYATKGADFNWKVTDQHIISRRFIFELIRVEGNAVLHTSASDSGTIKDRNKSRLYCYLKAEHYLYQDKNGLPLKSTNISLNDQTISTPFIYYKGSREGDLNFQFPEYFKNFISSGNYNLGISIIGLCKEDTWNNDGPATLDLYYTYQGKKQKAMTLIIEGEFDESEFFGFEHAFDRLDENYTDDRYGKEYDLEYNIEDFIDDNFYGFILYDNDGNVAYKVTKEESRDVDDILDALRQSRIDGYATTYKHYVTPSNTKFSQGNLNFLKMPSNFVYADSYSWTFTTETLDWDDGRRLEDVMFAFCVYENKELKIAEDEMGNQMVTTNIDQMREGDPLRLTLRLNQLACQLYDAPLVIKAKINGIYDITLPLQNLSYDRQAYNYSADTFVFEVALPKELQVVNINSLTNMELFCERNPNSIFRTFIAQKGILSKRIHDIRVNGRDTRTPVATVNQISSDIWAKSKSLDIYVNTQENHNSRFNDSATVYYQWSNSRELPERYSSRVSFHTSKDKEIFKTIIGTGSGEMYLHIKTTSAYGKTSISDALTTTYDPNNKNAVYTPFGPYKFDNVAPTLNVEVAKTGNMKERTISIPLPDDGDGAGLKDISLYYVNKNGEETLLKLFKPEDFVGDSKMLTYKISHADVGIGIDIENNVVLERAEVEFFWVITDKLGNSSGKTAPFSLAFDTGNYIPDEVMSAVGPLDFTWNEGFVDEPTTVGDKVYLYDYKDSNGKTIVKTGGSKPIYYGFGFEIDGRKLPADKKEYYSILVSYNGVPLGSDDYSYDYGSVVTQMVQVEGESSKKEIEVSWRVVLRLHQEIKSGRYDITLVRSLNSDNGSEQVSQVYSVYATANENDNTAIKNKVESGTLLSNIVYQLSSEYPYFYYKDKNGVIQKVHYNNTKQPATFSSFAKAKEYVYYQELGDIYLLQLSAAIASALNSSTTGYKIAKGETMVPQEGQYWIRYKSESWTPSSGESAWVYYYYGTSETRGELTEGALSVNLQSAINSVASRIAGDGKTVILTDTSLFLDSAMGEKMLDKYGMPYLAPGQIHIVDEFSGSTMCGNAWSVDVGFAADRNIYKSKIPVGEEGSANYREYSIVGNFELPEGAIFQYKTYEQYNDSTSTWKTLDVKKGKTFIDIFDASGVYYIREVSTEGVSVYPIYIDKEAPDVTFSNTDEEGNLIEIPVDEKEVLEISTKDLYIRSISPLECDRLSYVSVYKISNLSFVGTYTAEDLDVSPIKLEDGNYYIVVSDRSGNHYTVTARVSSTALECSIKENVNQHVKLTCNRRGDQIQVYEVYLNGKLLTSTYKAEDVFEKAGLYQIYIQDIYGNEFSEEITFVRNYPTVTWKYYGADGKYHTYDPNDQSVTGFVLTWIYDNQYKISTAVKTRFTFSGNYMYEFVGAKPNYTETIGKETAVTIEAGQSFTLKVYYKDHKDCYSVYSGAVDVTPPSINVTADVDVLKNGEYNLFEEWVQKGNAGDVIKMDDLYYELSEIAHKILTNGETVSSDIIKINAGDANDLSMIEVYLNGELIKKQDASTGFSQIIVSQWGSYRVVARDGLGNISEFTFTNGMPNYFDYFVDGTEREQELHGHLNFEAVGGKHVYKKLDYGKADFKLNLKQNVDVFLSVGVSGGATEIHGFRISDGQIYPISYKIILDKNGKEKIDLVNEDAIFDLTSNDFKIGQEYLITKDGSYAVYASVDSNKVVSIRIYAPNDSSKVVAISARIEDLTASNTRFVSAELSKRKSNVSFEDLGVQTNDDIRVNGGFIIDESTFEDERIVSISLYYSKLNDLDASKLNEKTNVYTPGKEYDEEGFYLLIVRNHYGNETVYRISISRSFGVTSSVTFSDGHKIFYSKDYGEKLYSNDEIVLDILDEDVTVNVTLNGSPYTELVRITEGTVTYLVFSKAGTYEVSLTDSYGNEITRQLEINKSTYTVSDELLTGFNEKALKRDEGYTNQKLSINKTVYHSAGIYYLAIQYGEELNVLFDAFAESRVAIDESLLTDVIGASGDGVYRVICRNRYGAVVTKDIHYRGTPTLKLERTTRSKSESEAYDLSYALSHGFWSNNTLHFSTDAKEYVFTVDKIVTECPRTLVFENAGDFGSFVYKITYIDEYGFEYSFDAYLVRKSIAVDLPSDMSVTEIDGILNTKNDISITFGENIYATYTRNNGEEKIYHSGDVLKKDGTYRFTVIDYAGNATMVSIKKDTAVEFSFSDSINGTAIQNGGVVNSSKISFAALNKDSAYIEKVSRNGVLQTDFTGSKFTEDGKWEIILSDKLGNRAYFSFHIVTHAQNGFSYTTPYECSIKELWYDSGDGVKVSYLTFVNEFESRSSFSFTENGKYTVVMSSDATGMTSTFEFTVNTNAPDVSLVGCSNGETTINDVTLTGHKVGDRIRIYRATDTGEELVEEVEITSLATKIPTITEGGKYRIVVESEAGVQTELSLVRKHVMNTAGSVFIMVVIGLSVVGLFTGLVYRNKSKTDD